MSWCEREITVYAGGFLSRDLPTGEDCPYIAITDFRKKEGQDVNFCNYSARIFVGVETPDLSYETLDGVEIPNAYSNCSGLMDVVIKELNSTKRPRPLSKAETQGPWPISADGTHWEGMIDIDLRIYQTLGQDYTEEL